MTENNNLRKNAEGYSDLTPWKAFNKIHEGEIYTHNEKEVLIVRVQDGFCNILILTDEARNENCIEVNSRSIKYTDPAMLSYAFTTSLGGFVKRLPDNAFETVLRNVEAALMLEIVNVVTKENIVNVKRETEAPSDDSIYKRLYEELLEKVMKKAFG